MNHVHHLSFQVKLEDKTNFIKRQMILLNIYKKLMYELDEKNKNVILTDVGVDKIEKLPHKKIF